MTPEYTSGITTSISSLETTRPNSSDTASAKKIGASRMSAAPAILATAVYALGLARTTAESISASSKGWPARTGKASSCPRSALPAAS